MFAIIAMNGYFSHPEIVTVCISQAAVDVGGCISNIFLKMLSVSEEE